MELTDELRACYICGEIDLRGFTLRWFEENYLCLSCCGALSTAGHKSSSPADPDSFDVMECEPCKGSGKVNSDVIVPTGLLCYYCSGFGRSIRIKSPLERLAEEADE